MIIIVDHDAASGETLRSAIGPDARVEASLDGISRDSDMQGSADVVVLAPSVSTEAAYRLAESLRVTHPAAGVVLVRKRIDTTLLTEALRAGVREVVLERDLAAVSDAVRRVRTLAHKMREQGTGGAELTGDGPRGHMVTVFSAKGGCGKTTLSTNLAAALADHGRREVCLVDLDLAFGDVAIALQLFPAHTLVDAVPLAETLDAPGIRGLLTPHSPGLTTLVAPVEPGTAESIPAALVAQLLDLLRGMFDYVVVDTPPAFTDHVLAAFDASEVVALIATLDIPALKNLKLTLETLELLNYPRERWRLVLNRADSKVGLALSEVEKTLRVPISAQIPSSRSVPASINRGVPIVLDEPNHPVSIAIRNFAEKQIVHQFSEGTVPADLRTDRRSLLRRKAKSS